MNKIRCRCIGRHGHRGPALHPTAGRPSLVRGDGAGCLRTFGGQRYAEACHWLLPTEMPEEVAGLVVQPIEPGLDCRLVFSALPSGVAGPVEEDFARAGYTVCSNAAAHRMDGDVPLLIPEVNADHTVLIEAQRQQRAWPGAIVTSANCTTTQLALALKPLHEAFGLRKLSVVAMQAISGAGYPGVPAPDILGNVVPYIGGEEEKVESESRKLLGDLKGDQDRGGAGRRQRPVQPRARPGWAHRVRVGSTGAQGRRR